jgi:hypothetical protein
MAGVFCGEEEMTAALFAVMPAKAGIQKKVKTLDSRMRGNDNRGSWQ